MYSTSWPCVLSFYLTLSVIIYERPGILPVPPPPFQWKFVLRKGKKNSSVAPSSRVRHTFDAYLTCGISDELTECSSFFSISKIKIYTKFPNIHDVHLKTDLYIHYVF